MCEYESCINHAKTKLSPKTRDIPRGKHLPPRLKKPVIQGRTRKISMFSWGT